MILRCPECASQFRVADEQIKAQGTKVQCSVCSTKFLAKIGAEPTFLDDDDVTQGAAEPISGALDSTQARFSTHKKATKAVRVAMPGPEAGRQDDDQTVTRTTPFEKMPQATRSEVRRLPELNTGVIQLADVPSEQVQPKRIKKGNVQPEIQDADSTMVIHTAGLLDAVAQESEQPTHQKIQPHLGHGLFDALDQFEDTDAKLDKHLGTRRTTGSTPLVELSQYEDPTMMPPVQTDALDAPSKGFEDGTDTPPPKKLKLQTSSILTRVAVVMIWISLVALLWLRLGAGFIEKFSAPQTKSQWTEQTLGPGIELLSSTLVHTEGGDSKLLFVGQATGSDFVRIEMRDLNGNLLHRAVAQVGTEIYEAAVYFGLDKHSDAWKTQDGRFSLVLPHPNQAFSVDIASEPNAANAAKKLLSNDSSAEIKVNKTTATKDQAAKKNERRRRKRRFKRRNRSTE